jgi:GT2 family glycosyltransferase
MVELELGPDGLAPAALAETVWAALGPAVEAHLRADGLPIPAKLGAEGLPLWEPPACLRERVRFLGEEAPLATVVVCTRDRTASLAGCLPSLMRLEYPRYEVVVVDNAPATEETAALVAAQYGTGARVRYVREERPGLSWARNRGLAEARGEIIAFTDDDVVVDPGWLAALAQAFASVPGAACVTGLTLPAELETPAQEWFQQFGGFNKGRSFERQIYDLGDHRPNDPLFPYTAGRLGAGVNMAYRASVLRSMRGFDPVLGMLCEDIDACFRVIVAGGALVVEPAAVLRHYDRREYADLLRQVHRYGSGFAAFLIQRLISDPRRALDMARALPEAARYLLSGQSARNEHKSSDYPWELTRSELAGMLSGPRVFLCRYWETRRTYARFRPVHQTAPARGTSAAGPC